jgi:hypothetical protein
MTSNLPKLSPRAQKALDILADGGSFHHVLETNSYTRRDQFQYRLKGPNGGVIKGVGLSAFYELRDAGMLYQDFDRSTSHHSYYFLRRAA